MYREINSSYNKNNNNNIKAHLRQGNKDWSFNNSSNNHNSNNINKNNNNNKNNNQNNNNLNNKNNNNNNNNQNNDDTPLNKNRLCKMALHYIASETITTTIPL